MTRKWRHLMIGGLSGCVGGFVFGALLVSARPEGAATPSSSRHLDLGFSYSRIPERQDPLSPLVKEIAEHFLCGCMQCGDMILAECTCPDPKGGLAEKEFIRSHLVTGRPKDEIIDLVQKRFGRRIPTHSELERLDSEEPDLVGADT